jgi:hypothetical protein
LGPGRKYAQFLAQLSFGEELVAHFCEIRGVNSEMKKFGRGAKSVAPAAGWTRAGLDRWKIRMENSHEDNYSTFVLFCHSWVVAGGRAFNKKKPSFSKKLGFWVGDRVIRIELMLQNSPSAEKQRALGVRKLCQHSRLPEPILCR